MKYFLNFCYLVAITGVFFSCSDDDTINEEATPTNATIVSYTETTYRPATGTYTSFEEVRSGAITNNKFGSYTKDIYIDNLLMESHDFNRFTYTNDLCVSFNPDPEDSEPINHQLFYDSNNDIIGGYMSIGMYYKFYNVSGNTWYIQVLNGPIDNVNTTIMRQTIVELDANDNVISAGHDFDLDGVPTNVYHYSYDSNNNLTAVTLPDGSTENITYSNIKNTESFVLDNSYGHKIRRLSCGEVYAGLFSQTDVVNKVLALEHSTYLSNDEVAAFQTIETGYDNYYTKTVELLETQYNTTETVEFTFQ